jgi:hypothetical protein
MRQLWHHSVRHKCKMFLPLLSACFIRCLMLVIVSSSPVLSLLYDSFTLYRATFLKKVTPRSSFLLYFFHCSQHSDSRKSIGTAVIVMQMFRWNSFFSLRLQCVLYNPQNCCNLFSSHSTTHILSLSVCLSISDGLNCSFHVCGAAKQYGWGFPGFGICSHLIRLLGRGASPSLCL